MKTFKEFVFESLFVNKTISGKSTDIYKNPDLSEINKLMTDYKQETGRKSIFFRGYIDKNFNLYLWIGNRMHYSVIDEIENDLKISLEDLETKSPFDIGLAIILHNNTISISSEFHKNILKTPDGKIEIERFINKAKNKQRYLKGFNIVLSESLTENITITSYGKYDVTFVITFNNGKYRETWESTLPIIEKFRYMVSKGAGIKAYNLLKSKKAVKISSEKL